MGYKGRTGNGSGGSSKRVRKGEENLRIQTKKHRPDRDLGKCSERNLDKAREEKEREETKPRHRFKKKKKRVPSW